jgi:hypothetical protein
VRSKKKEDAGLSVPADTVARGSLIRDVRGLGTLVPEDVPWVPTRTDARRNAKSADRFSL